MLALAFATVLLFVSKTAAQGVTTAFLENNATTARLTTLVLQVTRPVGTPQGIWYKNNQLLPVSNRYQTDIAGNVHRLNITNVEDSDAGYYFNIAGGRFTGGFVTVVPNAINGGFGDWTVWRNETGCSVTCGGGTQRFTRSRACDRPLPEFGGLNCTGPFDQSTNRPCNTDRCPGTGGVSRQEIRNNATTSVGRTIILEVRMTQNRNLGFWYLNSRIIADSSETRYAVSGFVHQLTISNVQLDDAGLYYYIAAGTFVQGYLTVLEGPVAEGLCEDTEPRNGVRYRYHPTDCDKYIQCYLNPNAGAIRAIAVIRSCSFGNYWNPVTYTCEEHWNVKNCPVEKCNGSCGLSFKIAGSCGSYWQCGETGPEAMFCPQGFSFFQGRGCRRNPDCDDVCPSPYISRDTCTKRMTWDNNVANYETYAGDLGWRLMTCPSGTFFDIGECGCKARNDGTCAAGMSLPFTDSTLPSSVTRSNVNIAGGIAIFNEQSSMTLDVSRMPTSYPKVMQIRYREASTSNTYRVLVSTTDSRNANSIVLSHNNNALYFKLKAWNNNEDMMSLSTAGMRQTAWKTVAIYYDSHKLVATVASGNMKNRASIYAPGLIMIENNILIGTDGTSVRDKHFIGSIDYVYLYNCDPGVLY